MELSKRERWLACGVGAVVLSAGAYYFILTPYLDQRDALAALRLADEQQFAKAQAQRTQETVLKKTWAQRRGQGLASDTRDAEHQLVGAVNTWATKTGFSIASVKPEYIDSKKELREIQVQATGSGNHEAIVKFLLELQNAPFPLRISEMQVSARTDSADLLLTVRLSTLYWVDDSKNAKKDDKKVAGAAAGGSGAQL